MSPACSRRPGHFVEESSGECCRRRVRLRGESRSAQRAAAVRGVLVWLCAPRPPPSSLPGKREAGAGKQSGGEVGRRAGRQARPQGRRPPGAARGEGGPGRARRRPLRPPAAPYLSSSARTCAPAALPATPLFPPRPYRGAPRGRRLRGGREVAGLPRSSRADAATAGPRPARSACGGEGGLTSSRAARPASLPARRPALVSTPAPPQPLPPLTPARADPLPSSPDRRLPGFLRDLPTNEHPELAN